MVYTRLQNCLLTTVILYLRNRVDAFSLAEYLLTFYLRNSLSPFSFQCTLTLKLKSHGANLHFTVRVEDSN